MLIVDGQVILVFSTPTTCVNQPAKIVASYCIDEDTFPNDGSSVNPLCLLNVDP